MRRCNLSDHQADFLRARPVPAIVLSMRIHLIRSLCVLGAHVLSLVARGEPGAPDGAYQNSIGMTFLPVAATPHLKWSRTETREGDYATFCKETGTGWRRPDFASGPEHPVVNVTPAAAMEFCRWLEMHDIARGSLTTGERYRLPTDAEWSLVAGLSGERGSSAAERHLSVRGHWAWGKDPCPDGIPGNYPDEAWHAAFPVMHWLRGVNDGFACTAPVGSFPEDASGLRDFGGNVSEWVMPEGSVNIARGGSWHALHGATVLEILERSHRGFVKAGARPPVLDFVGFRVVLAADDESAADGVVTGALCRAARAGEKSEVERLLRDGAEAGARNTALQEAAERGHAAVCQLLLDRGADVRATNAHGYQPLHLALRRSGETAGAAEVVRILIAAGAPLDAAPAGDLPLVVAVRHAPEDIVAMLLERAAFPSVRDDIAAVMAMLGARRFDAAGHARLLTLLQKRGGDLSVSGRLGLNALFAACSGNPTRDHLAWLVDQGLNIDAVAGGRLTPSDICALRAAESDQAADALRFLLERGGRCHDGIIAALAWFGPPGLAAMAAERSDFKELGKAAAAMGQASGASSSALGGIAALGDAALLGLAVRKGVSVTVPEGKGSDLGLASALEMGRPDLVEPLLRAGASLAPDASGTSPMVLACRIPGSALETKVTEAESRLVVSAHCRRASSRAPEDRLRCVRLLLEAGVVADGGMVAGSDGGPDRRTDRGGAGPGSSAGESPLACAARADRTDLMELLLKAGAKVDSRDASGFTPLITAAEVSATSAMRLLLERGADVNALSDTGTDALMIAAAEGHAEGVALLIAHGAKMDGPAGGGRKVTPQEAAAWGGRVAILRRFAADGVRLKGDSRLMGATVIGASARRQMAAKAVKLTLPATQSDFLAVMDFLAENGESPDARHPDYGRPLLAACNQKIVSQDTPAIIDKLVAIGSDVNASDPMSALHEAVKVSPYLVRQLLRHGADPGIMSAAPGYRLRPLHAAAAAGRADTAGILLENGAVGDAFDSQEQTALYVAAGAGHLEVVSFLIKAGARVDQRNGFKEQATALHAAASNGRVDVIRALAEAGADPLIAAGHPLRSPELLGTTARQLAEKNGHSEAAELLGRLERDWKARAGSKGTGSPPRSRTERLK